MEQAFIKVKLLVKDKTELDNVIKEMKQKLQDNSATIGGKIGDELGKRGKTIGENMANSFSKVIAGSIFAKMSQLVVADYEKAKSTQQLVQDVSEQITTLQNMTGGNIGDTLLTQQLLNKSNTKNPIGFFNNFVQELNKARSGESQLLLDYTDMNNSQAFNKFMLDLSKANLDDRNKVISSIWGGIYADNANMILANDINTISKQTKNRITSLGGEKIVQEAIQKNFNFGVSEKDKQNTALLENMITFSANDRLDYIAKDNERQRNITKRAIEDIEKTSSTKKFTDNVGIVMTETAKSFADIMVTGAKSFVNGVNFIFGRNNDNNDNRVINGANK